MTHAEPEDLARLIVEPDAVGADVRAHVSGCADCAELAASLAAVASGVRASAREPLVAPPPGLRERVFEAIEAGTAVASPSPPPVVPIARASARRSVPLWVSGVAAGLALIAGVGLGRLGSRDGETTPTEAVSFVAAADLAPLRDATTSGTARAVQHNGVVNLRVSADPLKDSGIYEVWLLHEDGTRMVALGFLAAGTEGDFVVPAGLLGNGYRTVDISLEPDDGNPAHSGVSLARGTLA